MSSARVLLLIVMALGPAPIACAQLTSDEVQESYRLLKEPDNPVTIEKRLKLFRQGFERQCDPKRALTTYYGIELKKNRIPAAEGVPFVLSLFDAAPESVQQMLLHQLGEYGPEAKGAEPKLRQLLDDMNRNVRALAMLTLAKVEPENADVATMLLGRLGDKSDDHTNRTILEALHHMVPAVPKAAVPQIAKYRTHKWSQVGLSAYELAGKVLALPKPPLDELRVLNTIDWRNAPDQAYSVLTAIGEAGPKAVFADALLVELLVSDPPVYLQCAAIDTLGRIKTGNPRVITAFLEGLGAKDFFVRHKARTALLQVDVSRPESMRAMAKGMRHAEVMIRFEAATRLWVAAARAEPLPLAEAVPALTETLRECDATTGPGVIAAYVNVAQHTGPAAAPVAESLLRIYGDEGYFKKHKGSEYLLPRGRLLTVLADVGVPASAGPVLVAALKANRPDDPNQSHTFAAAARAVGGLGTKGAGAVPHLVAALAVRGPEKQHAFVDWSPQTRSSPYTTARLEAVRALGKIGPDAKEALPQLRKLADRTDAASEPLGATIRQEAQRAVAAIEGRKNDPPSKSP